MLFSVFMTKQKVLEKALLLKVGCLFSLQVTSLERKFIIIILNLQTTQEI